MLGVALGVFMGTLDASIVNIALPTLVRALSTSFATVQWVVLGYLVAVTALLLGAARLGDMVGKRPVYLAGLLVFTAGSLGCGLAPDVDWLIAARVLQGVGASMTTSVGVAILTEVFPPRERGRALGIIGAVVSLGIALGPTLGGVLVGRVGWRSIFLVNVPVGLGAALLVARVLPAPRPGRTQRFDFVGALLVMLSLGCYALGMTLAPRAGFTAPRPLGLLLVALLALVAFLAVERRVAQPMLDLGVFENPTLGLNLLMGMLVFFVLAGQALLMPFFLSLVRGYPTETVGLLLVTVPVCMAVSSPLAGALSDRFGSRGISVVGLSLIAVGCLLVSGMTEAGGPLDFVLRVVPTGLGVGLFQAPNNSAIMGAVPRGRLGVGSGLLSLSRTLGQSSGFPLMGALFAAQVFAAEGSGERRDVTEAPKAALVAGLHGAFHVAVGVVLLAVALALVAWRLDRGRPAAAVRPPPPAPRPGSAER